MRADHASRWLGRSLLGEVFRNAIASWVRSVLICLVVVALVGAMAVIELDLSATAIVEDYEFWQRGGGVFVVFPPSTEVGEAPYLSGSRCEALSHGSPGVLSSGGVRGTGTASTIFAPGIRFQVWVATPGVFRTFGLNLVGEGDTAHPLAVAGGDLAQEVGLTTGEVVHLDTDATMVIAGVLDADERALPSGRWLMRIGSPQEDVDQCWVEFDPGSVQSAGPMLRSYFSSASGVPAVRRHSTTSEAHEASIAAYNERLVRGAWLPAALVLAGAIWFLAWTRRSEIALYLTLGMSRLQILVMSVAESLVWSVPATLAAISVAALVSARSHGFLLIEQLVSVARSSISAVLLGCCLGSIASIGVARSVLDALKDR